MNVQKPISTGPFPMALLHFARPSDFRHDFLSPNGWKIPVSLPEIAGNLGRVLGHASISASTGDIALFEDGCKIPNAESKWPRYISNCTAACSDPNVMFADSMTIWNCATLAAADLLAQSGNLKLDQKDISLPNMFGFNASATIASLTSCAIDSCQSRDLISCPGVLTDQINSIGQHLRDNNTGAAMENLQGSMASYCDAATADTLANVAGPGVLISFIIMALLSLSLFFLLKPFTSWARLVLYPVHALFPRPASESKQPSTAWEAAKRGQTYLSRTRAAAALFSTLVDFHELQLYLILAIQISALVGKDHLPTATSFASYFLSNDFATALGIIGFLPALLTEIQLRRARPAGRPTLHSWWTLLLTTAAWAMAGAILAVTNPYGVDIAASLHESRGVAACGGNAGLAVYCGLERAKGLSQLSFIVYSLGVGYPAIPGLWVQQIAWAIACRGKTEEAVRRRGRYGIGIAGVMRRRAEGGSKPHRVGWYVWVGILEFIWALFQGATLVFMFGYIVVLFRLVGVIGMSTSQWTFGQAIALAVWVPILTRYLGMNLLGIQSLFGTHLMEGYEVVRREKEDVILDGEDSPFADAAPEDGQLARA